MSAMSNQSSERVTSNTLRLALVQLAVSRNSQDQLANISRAISFVEQAKQQGADIVVLPECFTIILDLSLYGTAQYRKYSESIPGGKTSLALSDAAKKNRIWIIGGSIDEQDGEKYFNTCTVWNPEGKLVGKYRKTHLYDVDMEGWEPIRESSNYTSGDALMTFMVKGWKIGLGMCYDLRFGELAHLYRKSGCQLLLYPSAFNVITGPMHWSLLQRARAVDNQLYVAGVSPAQTEGPGYIAYGHSQLTDPWGRVLKKLESGEDMLVADIDLAVVDDVRTQIPVFSQRRTDLYETFLKK